MATISTKLHVNCDLQPFLKSNSYFEMWTLPPILNLGFPCSQSGLRYRTDKKSEFLTFLVIKSMELYFWTLGLWRTQTLYECTPFHNLPLNGNVYFFPGSWCTFSKCSLSLTHFRVELYSFSFSKFCRISSKFCSVVGPNFLRSILFCNHNQKCTNCFFGILCFCSFWIYGSIKQVLRNWWIP